MSLSQPPPLANVSSAVPAEQHRLTPRSPRPANGSRTSRLEQGFAEVHLSEANEVDFEDDSETLQSAPLLASSSTARFSLHNSRGRPIVARNDDGRKTSKTGELLSLIAYKLSLAMGVFIGVVLLFLLVMSLTRPQVLYRYIGTNTTLSSDSGAHSVGHTGHKADGLLSYENYTRFPLQPYDYLRECAKLHKGYMQHGDYWDIGHMGGLDVQHTDDSSICSKTITYMLDGTVGLTADLAIMAQAAALARERNRTFFVDDTFWNRGKWTDHFEDVRKYQPGPQPGCKPPPANELVACPRTARHWVINSRTAKFHFGHGFSNHYEDPYAHELNRLKPIFKFAQESFTSLIIPNTENRELIKMARHKLSSVLHNVDREAAVNPLFVSVHIRRGDRKTLSYLFPDRRIPIPNYTDAITSTWTRLHHTDVLPVIYLATDSPTAHQEFAELFEGVVFSLYNTDETRLRAIASPGEYYQQQFETLDLQQRISATRGIIVDLALFSGFWPGNVKLKPDAVICALSSNVCRLAPIGLGWDTAFGHIDEMGNIDSKRRRWIEIDQKGQVLPEWEAFELF